MKEVVVKSLHLVLLVVLFLTPSLAKGETPADLTQSDWVQIADGVYQLMDADGGRHLRLVGEAGLRYRMERFYARLEEMSAEERESPQVRELTQLFEELKRGLDEGWIEIAPVDVAKALREPHCLHTYVVDSGTNGCTGGGSVYSEASACYDYWMDTGQSGPVADSKMTVSSCQGGMGWGNAYAFKQYQKGSNPPYCEQPWSSGGWIYGSWWEGVGCLDYNVGLCRYAAAEVLACQWCAKKDLGKEGEKYFYEYYSAADESSWGCCALNANCDPLF